MTRKELAERIGISDDGIKYNLKKLKDAKLIRHVGATKAGNWEILK
ncbi:MAG: helix-turn-helix domain-containing protein [Thermodesulfobacteriota bacterium]|nr:helix-turn-helix domain-containing protein [Thermodesulfobacteriota bacterium]